MFPPGTMRPNVNAISPRRPQSPEQRREQHLLICEELLAIAMDLARAAGREAAREAAAQEASHQASHQAEAQTSQNQPVSPAKPKPGTAREAAALFNRLSATIHRFIALEAKLLAGPEARRKPATPPADPRRATLRQVFQHVTERNPNRAEIRRQTSARLEEILAEDPNGEIHIGDVFTKICEDLAVDIDLATLPDALLDILCPEDPDDDPPTLENARPFQPSTTAP